MSLINSTVSGNIVTEFRQNYGYGERHGGGIYARSGAVSMVNSTVSGNTNLNGSGGGIFSNSTLTINNSIVAGNTAIGSAFDIDANGSGFLDLMVNFSLIGDTAGLGITVFTGIGNILNQPALLGPLADNGGSTLTHALLDGQSRD